MSEIKNGGLDQYGAGPFEQQLFGTAGVEGVNGSAVGVLVNGVVIFQTTARKQLPSCT